MEVSLAKLQEIFRSALDEPVELTMDTDRNSLESWDSINHLNLIVELEDQLKVSLTKDEIEHLDSVSQILKILKDK